MCLAFRVVFVIVSSASMLVTRVALTQNIIVGEEGREVRVIVPPSYDPDVPTPLVIALHGWEQFNYIGGFLRTAPVASAFGFLIAEPSGTQDVTKKLFWNATPACCDGDDAGVNDSAYLRGIIDETMFRLNVDDQRVYVVGHSNGGFMAERMACEHADIIAGIANFAGSTFADPDRCAPTGPVHVLRIHGTDDSEVLFGGGEIFAPYPGAVESVEMWAARNGCSLEGKDLDRRLDLVRAIPGVDTVIRQYDTGCDGPGLVELWTIENGRHHQPLTRVGDTTVLAVQVANWLLARPKVGPNCPIRLQAERVDRDQVSLTWTNGTVVPSSVDIFRNGVLVADNVPADPPEFIDMPEERGTQVYRLEFDVSEDDCAHLVARMDDTPPCDTHCNALTVELISAPNANVRVTVEGKDDSGGTISYRLSARLESTTEWTAGPQTDPVFDLELPVGDWTITVTADDETLCDPPSMDRQCETIFTVPSLPQFTRGDCNDDGRFDVSDAACALNWLFGAGGQPGCLSGLDANGDAEVNIADPLTVLNFLFGAGPTIPGPFPDCGPGTLPSDAELGCANPPDCR